MARAGAPSDNLGFVTTTEVFPQRRIVTVLSVTQVIGGLGVGATLAVAALIVRDISGSTGLAGLAVVMVTFGAALLTLFLARIAVRNGRRPALTLGWALATLGGATTVAGAEWESVVVVLAGLLLLGAGTSANLQSRFAAADRADPRQIGRTLSIVVWSTTVGAVAGPNLTGPGATIADSVGLPDLAGPLLISTVCFAAATLLTFLGLRPDPLDPHRADAPAPVSLRSALGHVRGPAAVAIGSITIAHGVMVGVMALTPVHMEDHGSALHIIGLTISIHIAGMFALSPIFGWMSDTWGAAKTITLGQLTLIAAVAVAGTSGHSEPQITVGLCLLGVGWSASTIAGAALLTEVVDPAVRTPVQGLSDFLMQVGGATAGLLAGVIMAGPGYGTLNLVAGVLTAVVLVTIIASRRERVAAV